MRLPNAHCVPAEDRRPFCSSRVCACVGSEYPDRVRQCKDACAAMRAAGHTGVRFLRDATLEMLASVDGLPELARKRARHGMPSHAQMLLTNVFYADDGFPLCA